MKNVSITGKALRVTIASFFVANVMTVIGSVIDGFVIGNAMDESAAAEDDYRESQRRQLHINA